MRALAAILVALLATGEGLFPTAAVAQDPYDPSWYAPDAPHVKIGVTEDGVYRVSGEQLQSALPAGTSPSDIAPQTLRLIENGREVPIQYVDPNGNGALDSGDSIIFVGRRNRGTDEAWAYNYDTSLQNSTFYSLYSDTTHYWLTWGGDPGLRYRTPSPGSGSRTTTLRDTLHLEQDNTYFYGSESADPRYTLGEGYYWDSFRLNATGTTQERTYTLPLERLDPAASAPIELSVRMMGSSGSCHRVALAAEFDAEAGFEPLDEAQWNRYTPTTLQASIAADRLPSDGQLQIRITAYGDESCGTPNYTLLDWIEATYTRQLAARGSSDRQRFSAPAGTYTFELSGHTGPVDVYSPATARRYRATPEGNVFTFPAEVAAPTTFWVAGSNGYRPPASIRPDTPSNWAAPAHQADYVILTTRQLRPSAEALADYRRSHNGFAVAVVNVQDVFDEFDYGRVTPIAIRRFVRQTQSWEQPPRFLMIWADAPFPIYTESGVATRRPDWSVPSFGYGPSDAWFAMQNNGLNDWTESVAIGRIPIRTNEQGTLFLQKLQTYESAPLEDWQKRMLMLAGGTSESEQRALQFFTKEWAMTATGIPGDTLYTAGMDTLFYFKNVNDPLDTSFQDSLDVDLRRGTGWLNYFGHSAAQTWEIVTEPPADFENAGRLPFVVSLGCKTGAFAGGRFTEKDDPSLGEELVVGSLNGGIAHWGTSELGNRLPSARLNNELIDRVFADTARTMGLAIQDAKAAIADRFGNSDLYVRHLLQYSLLGDPALHLALPTQPDFHLAPELVSTTPVTPTPGETLTLTVRLRNRGLVPADSVTLRVTREAPNGTSTTHTRRLPRFALEQPVEFSFPLDEAATGANTFRITADSENAYAEANEANNTVEKTQVVFSTGLEIVAPRDQGIVLDRQPTLRLSLQRNTPEAVPVVVELDSVPGFDSGFLKQAQLAASDLAIDWQPPVSLQPGQTYYWRARTDDGSTQPRWTTGSFTVRPDLAERGWLQQGRQFQTNPEMTRLSYRDGRWHFGTFELEVMASSERGSGNFKGQFVVGASRRYERLGRGFGVLVLDDTTGQVLNHGSFCTYEVPDHLLDDGRCTGNIDGDEAIAALQAMIDGVEHGDYVFTRTRHLGRSSGPAIPDAVKNTFCSLGTPGLQCSSAPSVTYSDSIASLDYRDLWIMQTRKGFPEETVEVVARSEEDTNEIVRQTRLSFYHASGQLTTGRIGPAQSWKQLDWTATRPTPTGNLQIDVLSSDGATLLKHLDFSETTRPVSLSDLDAAQHPFLRLRATLTDSTNRVPPQLQRWRIAFEPAAELAINSLALQTLPDTVKEGQSLSLTVPVRNLGDTATPPVRIRYRLTDAANRTRTAAVDTIGALGPDEQAESTASISTVDLSGPTRLMAQVEHDGPPEPITSNNTIVRSFYVRTDQQPPTLSVLVEGRELPPNPEPVTNLQDPSLPFVSTRPTIDILASDDSEYFPLADTSLVEVQLDDQVIPFSSPDLTFEPASEANNEARIIFTPDLSGRDTTHTLRVEARDVSGNELAEPYQVHFRVRTDQVIRDLYPYPNPMNTHTTFAFRVEGGAQSPSDFHLRIYTLSGRLIRTFDGFDVNDGAGLRIGWNKLRWNGRDQDGDRVATGVYLYRVSMDGENGTFEGDVEKIAVIR